MRTWSSSASFTTTESGTISSLSSRLQVSVGFGIDSSELWVTGLSADGRFGYTTVCLECDLAHYFVDNLGSWSRSVCTTLEAYHQILTTGILIHLAKELFFSHFGSNRYIEKLSGCASADGRLLVKTPESVFTCHITLPPNFSAMSTRTERRPTPPCLMPLQQPNRFDGHGTVSTRTRLSYVPQ
ncbi:hypothetical protein AVEN_130211-1 [Araneus ventricosus]|uniref:Uncharacterized protein n=1 Tax=Araneus ventricosus TaxID=182803 RepID=A0A4Y2GHN2_ARAVE|nr:hypothetical protein AVEN_130211-1 [Araneus ventricosus]